MATLQQIENAITQVPVIVDGLISDEAKLQMEEKITAFNEKKEQTKFIKVPFVGAFSAGKTTLMNSLVKRIGLLPTAILPKTAIPCELYYDEEERVELYENGEKIIEGLVEDFPNLQTHVGQVAKVFLNSEILMKYMEKGIILVDMPGLGSGIEQHDTAIFNYIGNEAVFVYCIDVLTGSLDKPSILFLKELNKYGQPVAVIATKKNMSNGSVIEEVKESISYELSQIGFIDPYVGAVGASDDVTGITNYLDNLDTDAIRANIMRVPANLLINNTIEQLSIRKAVRTTDMGNADAKIEEIESKIEELKDEGIVDVSLGDTPEKSTEDVLENVKISLNAGADDIAQMFLNGSSLDDINSTIIGIIRPEIITSIQEESQEYMDAVNAQVDKVIIEALLNMNIPEINVEPDTDTIGEFISQIEILVEILPEQWRETARRVLEALPIIAAAFSRVVSWLGVNQDAQIDKVRDFFVTSSIPSIIENLRPNILKVITKNQNTIKEQITKETIAKVEQYKNELLARKSEVDATLEQIEQEVAKLDTAIIALQNLIWGI